MLRVRKAGRLLAGVGLALALLQATVAPAQATFPKDEGLPYGEGVSAKVDGALTVPVVLGPDLEHVFPTGGAGMCDPSGTVASMTGKVGRKGMKGAELTDVEYAYAAGDVVIRDNGVICGKLSIASAAECVPAKKAKKCQPDGRIGKAKKGRPASFKLNDVTAELEILGYGAFAPHIPEGCSLSLEIGTLRGRISSDGPPNAATLSAKRVSIGEASADKCAPAYSHLLNVGFGLPTTNAQMELDLQVHWGSEGSME